jgi:putative ABC transport system permease protein
MNHGDIALSTVQVACAAGLMLVNIGISWALRLGLEKTFFWASVRMVGQLTLLGLILSWIFARQSLLEVLLLMFIMTFAAGSTAVSRVKHPYRGLHGDGLMAIAVSTWLMTAFMIGVVKRPEPWYLPQLLIPSLGMILGNGISGIALALDRFLEQVQQQRESIEGRLLLGATRWEAVQDLFRDCLRTGLMPTTNAMMAAGLVSLPGMMTGQLLGGGSPQQAVNYQIAILFLILTSTMLGTSTALWLAFRRVFTPEHRLNPNLWKPKKS